MNAVPFVRTESLTVNELTPLDAEIVELPLLLPSWQMEALETAAHDQGLTAGQMIRHLIRDFFDLHTPQQRKQVPCWNATLEVQN